MLQKFRMKNPLQTVRFTVICALFVLCLGCHAVKSNELSQQQRLEMAVGQLSIEYANNYSYRSDYRGVRGAKTVGKFADIYQNEVKYLDDKYRVDFFVSALWIVPFDGGERGLLIDTIANDSACNDFLQVLDKFIKVETDGYSYQPYQYELAKSVKKEVFDTIKTSNKTPNKGK